MTPQLPRRNEVTGAHESSDVVTGLSDRMGAEVERLRTPVRCGSGGDDFYARPTCRVSRRFAPHAGRERGRTPDALGDGVFGYRESRRQHTLNEFNEACD